jgi:hypothetical protein
MTSVFPQWLRRPARPGGYRELMRVAGPLILSMSSFTIMHFCDRVMLTHYSEATAAAATGAGVLAFALLSFAMGIASYVNTFVAQYYGAGDREMCTRSLWQGLYFSLACAVVYPLVALPVGLLVLRWIGHTPAVLAAEQAYFGVLAAGTGAALINYTLSSFFGGCGRTWTIMWVDLFGAVINIILNYAVHQHFPRAGHCAGTFPRGQRLCAPAAETHRAGHGLRCVEHNLQWRAQRRGRYLVCDVGQRRAGVVRVCTAGLCDDRGLATADRCAVGVSSIVCVPAGRRVLGAVCRRPLAAHRDSRAARAGAGQRAQRRSRLAGHVISVFLTKRYKRKWSGCAGTARSR